MIISDRYLKKHSASYHKRSIFTNICNADIFSPIFNHLVARECFIIIVSFSQLHYNIPFHGKTFMQFKKFSILVNH